MTKTSTNGVDWRALWASGDLARFCFISLGILLHATNETMVATVMPAMVGELAGVQLVGWSLAIYELGAIVAGAAAGRLVSYVALRTNMMVAAMLYAAGALVCATAPSMPLFLCGRLIEGLGGGALVSLAFVSVERLFARAIWPQLFGVMSAIWGVAAFSGPVLGAVMTEFSSWRWAFGVFTLGGTAMALASFLVLDTPEATRPQATGGSAPPFPFAALGCLAGSVVLIATAGVDIALLRSSLLLTLGLIGLALFIYIDALKPRSRLFPSVGAGMTMVAAFSVATCSFAVYGPLLLTSLHGIPILTTGYIIAAESIAWSILSILVANAPPERERLIIVGGALMVATGVAGFAYTVPAGSIPLILFCALLQGGGFGIAWPFVTRVIVVSAKEGEQTIASAAVPTMQRIGYAVGAALTGIVANASGFSEGLNREAAANVAAWLFLAFIPLGILGCLAALRISGAPPAKLPISPFAGKIDQCMSRKGVQRFCVNDMHQNKNLKRVT
ncbi:MFS transporter [Mesorhizobium sp. M0955]|uniref:MFS transporter n=1 Tax=Mesorhizobium sp. M0955 TaxID=2957033 RepID=UPI003336FBC3